MKNLLLVVSIFALFISGCGKTAEKQCPYMECDAGVKPTLYIIGDSTVHNTGEGLQGWGDIIDQYFDLDNINVVNKARGGRSSRSFITEGLWQEVVDMIQPGDYFMVQFGHNDGGPYDTGRARASLKGTGNETKTFIIESTGQPEVVKTYGGYMRQYVNDARAKGAQVIVCSLIPRNMWDEGNTKVLRGDLDYALWAEQIAKECNVGYINLNDMVAVKYEGIGAEKVGKEFFLEDHTHTTPAGAEVNAKTVVEGIMQQEKCDLKKYVKSVAY